MHKSISKIEAARRLLDEAVRLWLEGRDSLAVHTLTMAAFGILYDLAKRQHLLSVDHPLEQLLSYLGQRQFRLIASFLKHADQDPLGQLDEPDTKEQEYRIGLALVLYQAITRELTPEMGAFHLMSLLTYPDLFRVAPDTDPDVEAGAQHAACLARDDVELRRMDVRVNLDLMKRGVLPANIGLKRVPST
jgi:hypothetical protein